MPLFLSEFKLAVGKSGEAEFGEAVKIYVNSAIIPFMHNEWHELSEKLKIFSRQSFEEKRHVDANLFIDGFKVESCPLDKKRFLKFNRCDTTVYFDEFMTWAILNVFEMLNFRLDLLSGILFYDHYKG